MREREREDMESTGYIIRLSMGNTNTAFFPDESRINKQIGNVNLDIYVWNITRANVLDFVNDSFYFITGVFNILSSIIPRQLKFLYIIMKSHKHLACKQVILIYAAPTSNWD